MEIEPEIVFSSRTQYRVSSGPFCQPVLCTLVLRHHDSSLPESVSDVTALAAGKVLMARGRVFPKQTHQARLEVAVSPISALASPGSQPNLESYDVHHNSIAICGIIEVLLLPRDVTSQFVSQA